MKTKFGILSQFIAVLYLIVGIVIVFKINKFVADVHEEMGVAIPEKIAIFSDNPGLLLSAFIGVACIVVAKDVVVSPRTTSIINVVFFITLILVVVLYPIHIDIIHMPFHAY